MSNYMLTKGGARSMLYVVGIELRRQSWPLGIQSLKGILDSIMEVCREKTIEKKLILSNRLKEQLPHSLHARVAVA